MATPLNFDSAVQSETVTIPDNLFAIHALAIIQVHDEQGEEQEMTLTHIAMSDEHIKFTRGTIRFSYFVTFGRQAIPLLRKTLAVVFRMSDEEIGSEVAKVVPSLRLEAKKRFIENQEKAAP